MGVTGVTEPSSSWTTSELVEEMSKPEDAKEAIRSGGFGEFGRAGYFLWGGWGRAGLLKGIYGARLCVEAVGDVGVACVRTQMEH